MRPIFAWSRPTLHTWIMLHSTIQFLDPFSFHLHLLNTLPVYFTSMLYCKFVDLRWNICSIMVWRKPPSSLFHIPSQVSSAECECPLLWRAVQNVGWPAASDSSVDMGAGHQPDTNCLQQTLEHLSTQTFNNMVLWAISGYLPDLQNS